MVKYRTNVVVDKFVVKMPAVSWTEKTRSDLPPNLTSKDITRKYLEGTFHVDNGLMQHCDQSSLEVCGGQASGSKC